MDGRSGQRRRRPRRAARRGRGDRLGRSRAIPTALATALDQAPRRPLGAAAVRRHRELRPPPRRRPRVDVRQGRLRRAGGRAGADARARRAARPRHVRPGRTTWSAPQGRNLLGASVTILGGGGITESLRAAAAAVRLPHHRGAPHGARDMDGVDDVLEADRYADALPGADLVVLALALTPETEGIIAADELELMERHAWLVNVARGRHVVTDDLVAALRDGVIGGAGLDVTDPEPLPARPPAVVAAELHHHPARRQHAGDGRAAAGRADHRQRPPLRRRRGAPRARSTSKPGTDVAARQSAARRSTPA